MLDGFTSDILTFQWRAMNNYLEELLFALWSFPGLERCNMMLSQDTGWQQRAAASTKLSTAKKDTADDATVLVPPDAWW